MKNILVATDFSKAARSALLFATELAKVFNSRIILFSAYQPVPGPVADTIAIVTPAEMEELTQRQLDMQVHGIDVSSNISVQTLCYESLPVDGILKAAEKENADLIVAGMKSSNKGLRRIFGSTATGLARKTVVPLIIVPEETKYIQPLRIALASDLAPETDMQTIEALREIGNRFQSKLYIVKVVNDRSQQVYELLNRPARLSKVVRSLDPEYEFPEKKSIPGALDEFINTHHIDMLAMMPHKHSLLERWFIKSTTRSMLFKTHIPLLILPEIKIAFEKSAHAGQRGVEPY